MKSKLNRRLLNIGISCLIVAIVLIGFIFFQMKKAVEPEPREAIAYFNTTLNSGLVLAERDIVMKDTPLSMIPDGAIRDKNQLVDRKLIVDVNKNEFAILNKTAERGEVMQGIEEMWEIGIEVDDISNFLGSQIKTGEYYALLFADPATNTKHIINKVQVTALVDATGQVIPANANVVPKTITVAVQTVEEVNEIATYKMHGKYELVRPPKDWDFKK